jgi:phytoene desaturase
VIVVGAGIGGLSAAIHLAAAGMRVLVVEQNPAVGGKMGEVRRDGFRWDTGPSVITMRHVLDDLFAAAGRRLEDYLNLVSVEPLTRYFYPDGVQLDLSRDLPKTLAQIAALSERDVEGYLAFLAYAARLHRITGPVFIYDQPPDWRSLRRVPLGDTLHVDGLRTMQQAIASYVRSPHLRQLLGRFATYVGANPYQAPATLNVIAHVELNGGVWYPRGGVYRIAQALVRLAEELGVEIQTGVPVERLETRDGRVRAVLLADGRTIAAGAVIANLDVATVYERLLPPEATQRRRVQRLLTAEPSCSAFILLWGVRGHHPQLAHHNIFFSSDYRREFDAIFRHGVPADEPTVYLAITARTDPDHAPPGHENWFVLVNAPPLGARWDWTQGIDAYREVVQERLARFGLQPQVVAEQVLTPLDLQRLSGARRGALYGLSSNSPWTAFRRPHNRAPDVRGLYFAGGTAHPGGGVPMVMLSGRVAARLVLADSSGPRG